MGPEDRDDEEDVEEVEETNDNEVFIDGDWHDWNIPDVTERED